MTRPLAFPAPLLGALVACMSLVAPGGDLAAQTVSGVVVSEVGGAALPGAQVTLMSTSSPYQLATTTGDDGRFTLRAPQPGSYTLRVSQLGHAETTTDPIELEDEVVLEVEIRLGIDAIPLDPLRVVARRQIPRGRMRDFYERMNDPSIGGFYVTREEIDRRPMATPTALVTGAPGVTVAHAGSSIGLDRSVIMIGDCVARTFVDGVRIEQSEAHTLDDILHTEAIGGVEVYRSQLEAPAQYMDASPRACGVVLYWTRDPEPSTRGWGLKRIAAGVAVFGAIVFFGVGR